MILPFGVLPCILHHTSDCFRLLPSLPLTVLRLHWLLHRISVVMDAFGQDLLCRALWLDVGIPGIEVV